jgi:hypothetical protein
MADLCKHTNAVETEHKDAAVHVIFCPDCKTMTHVCVKPLFDHIEKNLETIRSWGVAFSKMGDRRASDSIAIQREMEAVIRNLREAVSMSRINKNEFLEQIATVFEERGQRDTAMAVRDLKLEVSIRGAEHVPAKA